MYPQEDLCTFCINKGLDKLFSCYFISVRQQQQQNSDLRPWNDGASALPLLAVHSFIKYLIYFSL